MLARNSAPGIGAQATPYLGKGQWNVGVNYRYQFSHRHFVGDEEQQVRAVEESEVENTIHLLDVAVTYALTARLNLSLGLPYLMAERSSPIRDAKRVVIGRHKTSAHGLGDISLMGRMWVLNPKTCLRGNISIGLGLKAPTGDPGKLDDVETLTGQFVRPVDQSIQPGDGGWGVIVELTAFVRLWRLTPYFTGLYLFNPRVTNGVVTNRTLPGEQIMSVADSFLVTAGTYFSIPGLPSSHGLAIKLGLRAEGVPTYDAIGDSDGFRRPGIALSVDPGISYAYERWSFNLSIPAAIYRNRFFSVADLAAGNGTHGDAAFADYLILLGVSRVFGN